MDWRVFLSSFGLEGILSPACVRAPKPGCTLAPQFVHTPHNWIKWLRAGRKPL